MRFDVRLSTAFPVHRLAIALLVVGLGAVLAACGDSVETSEISGSAAEETEAIDEPDGTENSENSENAENSDNAESGDGSETAGEPESNGGVEPNPGSPTGGETETLYPDVIDAEGVLDADGTWTISATLASPYDTPDRYADAWRVLGPDGDVLGTRELAHDHQAEQPFTRSQSGISIPDDVDVVTIEGRDQISGWGGQRFELRLDRTGGQ